MERENAQSKRDVIVASLLESIVRGELPRGSRVKQDELAHRFGMSITPVREALRLLESEGVVVGEPNRGVRVTPVEPEELKATYVMRRLAECYAMERAVLRVSRKDLQIATDLNARIAEAAAVESAATVREANHDFHFLFYARCGMPALVGRIRSLWLRFPWDVMLNVPERTQRSIAEHEAILAAVAEGEGEAAARATGAHLLASYLAVVERLTGSAPIDPFPPEND